MKIKKFFWDRSVLAAIILVVIFTFLVTATLTWAQAGPSPTPSATALSSPTGSPSATASTNTTIAFGKVVSVDQAQTSLNLQTDSQSPFTIKTDSNTQYLDIMLNPYTLSSITDIIEAMTGQSVMLNMPGMSNMFGSYAGLNQISQSGSFSNIATGDFVTAMITMDNNLVSKIYDIKFPSNIQFVNGTLSALLPNNYFTVTPPSPAISQAITLGFDSTTRFIFKGETGLKLGQSAGVMYDSSSMMAELVSIRPAAGAASASPSTTASGSPSSLPTGVAPSSSAAATPSASSQSNVTTVELTIQNHAFDKKEITVPEGNEIIINLHNLDAGVQHNMSIYNNSRAMGYLYKGAPITGPATITYQFLAPQLTATYYYQCDTHPEENGIFSLGGRNSGE